MRPGEIDIHIDRIDLSLLSGGERGFREALERELAAGSPASRPRRPGFADPASPARIAGEVRDIVLASMPK